MTRLLKGRAEAARELSKMLKDFSENKNTAKLNRRMNVLKINYPGQRRMIKGIESTLKFKRCRR